MTAGCDHGLIVAVAGLVQLGVLAGLVVGGAAGRGVREDLGLGPTLALTTAGALIGVAFGLAVTL